MMRLTIADNQDAMVKGGAAGRVEDAARVQLELALVGLNGHADGLVGRRLHSHQWHQTVHDWAGGPWQHSNKTHLQEQNTCRC